MGSSEASQLMLNRTSPTKGVRVHVVGMIRLTLTSVVFSLLLFMLGLSIYTWTPNWNALMFIGVSCLWIPLEKLGIDPTLAGGMTVVWWGILYYWMSKYLFTGKGFEP